MVLPSENILCQRKDCALDIALSPKACWSFPCVVVALSSSLTHKKDGIPLSDIPCFHFHDEVRKHVLTRQAPTPQWVTAKACYCKSGQRKDQGKRLSVLAGCSIASTARKKLVSLLYCRTSYRCFIKGTLKLSLYTPWRRIAPLILNLSCGWRWLVSFTPRPLYLRERTMYPVQ